jgi:hypothetical protein
VSAARIARSALPRHQLARRREDGRHESYLLDDASVRVQRARTRRRARCRSVRRCRRYALDDRRTFLLDAALLLMVAFYIYPLSARLPFA